jgi:biopolymer transport protein ExbD
MRFFVRKKHQPPAVIIVALIDVLIVVLIFLMVTTTFKKPLLAVKLALPESSQAAKAGATEDAPFVVSIESNGTFRIGPDKTPVTAEQMKQALAAAAAKNPQLKLMIGADKMAPVGQFMKVMDAVKEAHLQTPTSMFAAPVGRP